MKTKLAAAVVAALMVLAALPAGAHNLPNSVEVDGTTYGVSVDGNGVETITAVPAYDSGTLRTAPLGRWFKVDPGTPGDTSDDITIDHHDRHAGGTDDCTLWLGGFPGWTGNGLPGFKAHDPAADLFGLADDASLDTDPKTDGVQPYVARTAWEAVSHPRTSDWCYEGYVAGQRTSTTPSASSATRGGVAQERATASHGNPGAYKVFYCSDGVEQRRGAPATSGCLVLDGGRWTAGATVQFVKGSSYRGFVYTLGS